MKRDNTPWQPALAASVSWSDSGDPLSVGFDDVYYSRENGMEESRYVFLQGNNLPQRWQNWAQHRFCIAETGFGTGLNFLLTWQAWRAADAAPDLHYLSIEKYPLTKADIARALVAWPELAPLAEELLAQYPGLLPGQHRLILERGRITLDLWWEDVNDALPDLASHSLPMVDAWYLDGFAPARNPGMWQAQILQAVAQLSRQEASFSTFTAVGAIRRQLSDAGFTVTKVAGYGRKRECLRGRLSVVAPTVVAAAEPPWDLPAARFPLPATALVIGAGLAGCTVAAALARRGVQVTLLERNQLAGSGSGNDQGILYTRLSTKHSLLTDFSLQSFRFSTAFYRQLFATGKLTQGVDGALCGSFQQSSKTGEMAALSTVLQSVPELACVLDPEQASKILGIAQPAGGYWYPLSGWLRPGAVCRALAIHTGVRLAERCGAITLARSESGWIARDAAGHTWQAPCVVIATGTQSKDAPGLAWLPTQTIRGQTTHLRSTEEFSALKAVLCHEGYIAPPRSGAHCLGATFNLNDTETATRAADHRSNLDSLARAVPQWHTALAKQDPLTLEGRVGFRCASPDYLPMIGPVPNRPTFLNDFADLRRNAKYASATRGAYLPGLYLSTAHGSRGLTSTPLAAELLASQICGEPPPLSRELSRALAPARFIIRDLRRNRT